MYLRLFNFNNVLAYESNKRSTFFHTTNIIQFNVHVEG